MTSRSRAVRHRSFFREHSLSLVLAALLLVLFDRYARSNPSTHLGAFYGNAIADWLGVLMFVVATKYFFETGSAESRKPPRHLHLRIARILQEHSLTIVLAVTGIAWGVAFARSDVNSKAGQLIGNILSNWMQTLGMVLLTKYARERGSRESG